MSNEFIKNFIEFTNKIPSVEEGEFGSLTFSIMHEKEKPGKRNMLALNYEVRGSRIQIFVQSPKGVVFEGVNEKKLRSVNIGGKKFYTNYNPNLKDFVTVKGNFYTIVNDEVITILSPNKDILKLVETGKTLKFEKDLAKYAKKFTDNIDGFDLCMVNWKMDTDLWDISRMIFFNVKHRTEIVVDIFEGDKEAIEILWEEIEGKKKLSGSLYLGKHDEEKVLCCLLDKKRVMIARCTKGKKDLFTKVTQKIVEMLK